MPVVNPCDQADERRAAGIAEASVAIAEPSVLAGLCCEEASVLSRETYIPCGAPSAAIVWHAKDRRAYLMCAPCAYHNVRNRGGRLILATDAAACP